MVGPAPRRRRRGGVAAAVGMKQRINGGTADAQDLSPGPRDRRLGGLRKRRRADAVGLIDLTVCRVAQVKSFRGMPSSMCGRIGARDHGLHLVDTRRRRGADSGRCHLRERGAEDVSLQWDRDDAPGCADAEWRGLC